MEMDSAADYGGRAPLANEATASQLLADGSHPKHKGWYPEECRSPSWIEEETGEPVHVLQAEHLAAIYRGLRKAREDGKDEPGAADFYYGEMEMRRLSRETAWGERVVLYLYWLTSGYGLRSLRAFAWLAFVTLITALLFQLFGFKTSEPSFWDSLIYTAQSTISLPTRPQPLYRTGEVLRIALRLSGPVLLGLALLAVRSRVKR